MIPNRRVFCILRLCRLQRGISSEATPLCYLILAPRPSGRHTFNKSAKAVLVSAQNLTTQNFDKHCIGSLGEALYANTSPSYFILGPD